MSLVDNLEITDQPYNNKNKTMKYEVEELKKEVGQLKSLLFIHSTAYNQRDMANWIEHERHAATSTFSHGFDKQLY
jgi:hypothetical protein